RSISSSTTRASGPTCVMSSPSRTVIRTVISPCFTSMRSRIESSAISRSSRFSTVRLRRDARPPSTRKATPWKPGSRGIVSVISSVTARLQLVLEILLPARGGGLPLGDGVLPAATCPQRGPAVRDARREAGELLHRRLHRVADCPHGLVDGHDGIHGAVRGHVELVELCVDPIHRTPDFVDDRKHFTLRPLNERR